MNAPEWLAAAVVVGFFGVNGIWLAYRFVWPRSATLFWLVCLLIVAVLLYVAAMGAAVSIARALWPIPFDDVRGNAMQLRLSCEAPRLPATMLILVPVMLLLFPWALNAQHFWQKALANIAFMLCFVLVYASPIPDKLALLIFPEANKPVHCQ